MIKQFDTYSLLPHNTFGIEAKATHFVEFTSVADICNFLGNGLHIPLKKGGVGSKTYRSFQARSVQVLCRMSAHMALKPVTILKR